MDPTTPPWRVLDAPTPDDPPGRAAVAAPPPGDRWRDPTVLRVVGLVGLVAVIAVATFVLAASSGSDTVVAVDVVESAAPGGSTVGGGEIVVEVAGAVARPGVVRLPGGSRVADVIAAAGGYGPRVDTAAVAATLHLASVLSDGDRVVVPSRDDPVAAATAAGSADPGRIDLNTATIEQLDTLPGIGPVTAEKIIAAREEAPFASVDDLRSRGVLGEKTFERIRDLVSAG